MKGLMISCKKAGELIEKKNSEKLSFSESFQLRLHTAMCDICRLYEKQSKLINSLLTKGLKERAEPFTDTDVRRIKEKILNQNNS